MDRISNEPTNYLPLVEFELNGRLKMEGRSIPEDVNKFFNPLIEFVRKMEATNVVFDFNLEYFNTATSKKLLELMKQIEANNKIDSILINWHYEEGDEDSVEMAEIYEDFLFRSEFRYHEYEEVEGAYSIASVQVME